MDVVMDLLFKSDIGILSLFTILFIIGMAVYLVVWFTKKTHEREE